jgi:hypothetical protein
MQQNFNVLAGTEQEVDMEGLYAPEHSQEQQV